MSDTLIFLAFAAVLVTVLFGSTILAAPIRQRMLSLANELYDEPEASERLRRRIDFLLDSATSPVVAILMIPAVLVTLFDTIFFGGGTRSAHAYQKDERYINLVGLYLLSVFLANPFASVFAFPMLFLCGLIARGAKSIRGLVVTEDQIRRLAQSRLLPH